MDTLEDDEGDVSQDAELVLLMKDPAVKNAILALIIHCKSSSSSREYSRQR